MDGVPIVTEDAPPTDGTTVFRLEIVVRCTGFRSQSGLNYVCFESYHNPRRATIEIDRTMLDRRDCAPKPGDIFEIVTASWVSESVPYITLDRITSYSVIS